MPILNTQSPVTFQDTLPDEVDVVIIGGGIIGICTGWFLVKDGLSVLVCEKGRVAGEQSSRNWGWVRQMGRDEAELPVMMDAITIWEELANELEEDIGFHRGGILFLAENEKDQAEFEAWLEIAKQHRLDTVALGREALGKKLECKAGEWIGGLYTESDGRAEPFKAVPAMARGVQKKGGRIIENCAVRTIEKQAGKVFSVITEHGEVKTQSVVCAGGAWSSTFMRNLGISLPQLTVKGTVARTKPGPEVFSGCAASHKFAFRRRQDGGYTLALGNYLEHYLGNDSFRYFFKFMPAFKQNWAGLRLRFGNGLWERLSPRQHWQADDITPFEKTRVLNPAPNLQAVHRMRQRMIKSLPALAEIEIAEAWACMIDAPPDFVPYMDEVPGHAGLYIATGFSGHGFGIGPGAGKVMAGLVQNRNTGYDLHRFRFSRFTDGSPIIPGPAL